MALTPEQLIAYIEGLAAGGMTPQEYNDVITYILANGDVENAPRDLIQIRRGNEAQLPTLAQGELALTLDTEELYGGGANGNIKLNTQVFVLFKNFKPYGNGVDDDTQAFIDALSFVSGTGKVLYITKPSVKYKISKLTIPSNVFVIFEKDVLIEANSGFGLYDTLLTSLKTCLWQSIRRCNLDRKDKILRRQCDSICS